MSTATTIAVSVAPDAAARIRELGMEREFQMMVDKLKELIPGLREIEVSLQYPPDYVDDPMILLTTHQPRPPKEGDLTRSSWRAWVVDAFPADVLRHFVRLPFYEATNGR